MLYFVFLALTASKKSVTRSCLLTVETGWFGIFAKNPNLFYKILLEKNKCEKVVYVPFLFFLSSLDYHWGHESLSLTLLRALKEKRPKKSSNQIPVNSGKSSRYHSNSSFEIERGPWHSSWISGTIQIQNFILSNLGGLLEAKPYGLDRYLVPNRFAPLISPYLIKISK